MIRGDQPNKVKPASNSPKKSLLTRTGLYSLNQKELKTELKRIDLARRQYETYYSHEQRKVITRFATKLIRSTSNLEALFNPEQSQSSLAIPDSPSSITRGNVNEHLYENDSFSAIKKNSLLTLRREKTNLSSSGSDKSSKSDENKIISIKPVLKTNERNSANSERLDNPNQLVPILTSSPVNRVKKNVKWHDSLVDSASTQTSNYTHKTTLYEMNKKYDEFKLRYPETEPKVILPRLVTAKRDPKGIESKRNISFTTEIQDKITSNYTKSFIQSLNREDSGFFTYTNSKGEPLCDGFDNYAALVKTSPNKPIQIQELPQIDSSASSKPETTTTPPTTPSFTRSKTDLAKPTTETVKIISRPTSTRIRQKSAMSQRQPNLKKKRDDDEKLCLDIFKAQNIRSLTLKQLTTY